MSISSGPRAAFLRNVDGRRQFSRKRFTVANTLVSLVRLEYLVGSKRSSVIVERNERFGEYSWYCLWTSMSASFSIPTFFSGHPVSSCIKNAVPFHQLSSSISVEALSPCVSRSAGFYLVGTCLHCSGSINDCISQTRFAAEGLNFRLQPRIQYLTSILSDQNNHSCLGRFRMFPTASASRSPTTAAIIQDEGC